MKRNILILAASLIVCLGAGAIGSIFTTPAINSWYIYLNKPSFNPPAWIFAPVWTSLYILMAIAVFYVFQKVKENKLAVIAVFIFIPQLIFNILWSIFFFGAKIIPLAFADIIVLWLLIIYTVIIFWRIDKRASVLLWPYLAWVSFATMLNFSVMILNW